MQCNVCSYCVNDTNMWAELEIARQPTTNANDDDGRSKNDNRAAPKIPITPTTSS